MRKLLLVSKEDAIQFRLPVKAFERMLRKILRSEKTKAKTLELHLVHSLAMKKLNLKFRGKNKATDVLSFPDRSQQSLGTIVIDLNTATKQAKEFRHSTLQEVKELFVHGVFHLLGYDHEVAREAQEMGKKENQANRWWTSKP